MSLGLWGAACAFIGAILCVIANVRRGTSDEESERSLIDGVALIAPAAALLGTGLAVAVYPFVHGVAPDFAVNFYKDSLSEPVFITVAGCTSAICGYQGVRTELRRMKKARKASEHESKPPTEGSPPGTTRTG